jgi:hypothetical protein
MKFIEPLSIGQSGSTRADAQSHTFQKWTRAETSPPPEGPPPENVVALRKLEDGRKARIHAPNPGLTTSLYELLNNLQNQRRTLFRRMGLKRYSDQSKASSVQVRKGALVDENH